MLDDLGIRQKLSLLLVLPLSVVVCTIVPFTVERVDDARAAAVTARSARQARQVGGLAQDLQQERVVALAYLVLPATDRSAVLARQQLVDDGVARIRAGGPATDLAMALDRVDGLDSQRQAVLSREADPDAVSDAYRDTILALLGALHLTAQDGVDAAGLRQLWTLDALLRADQAAGDVAAALLVAAADRAAGAPALAAAVAAERQQRDRFRQLADDRQVALLDAVERGPSGQRFTALTDLLSGKDAADAVTVLGVADAYGALRQTVEDRIAADVARAADRRESDARTTALGVGLGAALMLAVVVGLSVRLSRSIAAPLRRLTRAAAAVADIAGAELVRVDDADEAVSRPTRFAAVNIHGQDEIGELAAAINRVQATAALLLERQVSTRRNVAAMFAGIARRTQGLVSRQLGLIDDMERDEQDSGVLERLYRLDHVTTRLRRSADSLLVVSGDRDGELLSPTPLATVIRAGTAEIEGFQAVRLGRVTDVLIAAELVADLRLLLAELLENATAFSPPGAFVEVVADLSDGCRITVADAGIGMPATRMEEENRRLVERPRLDVAPTDVLGLFVVGRLARRHGLTVLLAPTPTQGVTATVLIPPRLYTVPRSLSADLPAGPANGSANPPGAAHDAQPANGSANGSAAASPAVRRWAATLDDSFGWFAGQEKTNGHPVVVATAPAAAEDGRPVSRNGLHRRTPGRFASAFETSPTARTTADRDAPAEFRDAETEAAQLAAFTQGAERAAAGGPVPAPRPATESRTAPHGLTRRTPGAHLSASARPNPRAAAAPGAAAQGAAADAGPQRDPESERAALDGFVAGLAHAAYSLTELEPTDRKGQR
ncbi:nitrate- and nitrite sensing domain-containing protein [Dactylosporangium sp. NPDC005555]|uniref:sensor histidine kinase n=1 Tax=Dactylosporangium sp. NPDC005555 TaxID=3154889 RepID=UPI0033AEA10D